MKCIKYTYRKRDGGKGIMVRRVSDEEARHRIGNPNYTADTCYASKTEWKEGGRK